MAQAAPRRAASSAPQPFIVTLSLDTKTHDSLTRLRQQHFPPHRNHLEAHVTFFHALPASQLALYHADLESLASRTSSFPVTVGPPFRMQGGVGISILSDFASHHSTSAQASEIESLRARLLKRWEGQEVDLSNQDRQPLKRPHVTVQNKVEPEKAAESFEQISRSWRDREGRATGLGLWEYQKDGRWKHVREFGFAEEVQPA